MLCSGSKFFIAPFAKQRSTVGVPTLGT
jgi:hypothetical protein